ncbi:MAG: SLC13 family permease [Rickettsiales bacterium]
MFEPIIGFFAAAPHMWLTFAIIAAAIGFYVCEKVPMEYVSLCIITVLLLAFQFFPYTDAKGVKFNADSILAGFVNPAVIAVMSLLVLGQAVVQTGSLNWVSRGIFKITRGHGVLSIALTVFAIICISMFVNDTPTCVVFIPIMLAVAAELNMSASRVMMSVSYASILGGTVTLIGSSTNLLVSAAIINLGMPPLGMFSITEPGLIIAGVGYAYIAFILPRIMPDRAPPASSLVGDKSRQFVIQLEVDSSSRLIGKSIADPNLLEVDDVTVKILQRYEQAYLAPFAEPIAIKAHDVLVLTVSQPSLIKLITNNTFGKVATLDAEMPAEIEKAPERLSLVEILIAPASRMIGQSIDQVGFYRRLGCTVLGIQRRSRMITARMTEIRLAAGDVLMVMGTREHINALRDNRDVIVMEGSQHELPSKRQSIKVNLIFLTVILLAASEMVPIHLAALCGALLAIFTGCINSRQAGRAVNAKILFLIAAGIGMASALEVTGGAVYLAGKIVQLMEGMHPVWIMSSLFVLMALTTNVLSNNATALLFTPIAVNTARLLGVDPYMFIFAVIFASNCCSFASPIGFQTNLLVMGPGHYTFSDYIRGGGPLMLIVWATYTTYAFATF